MDELDLLDRMKLLEVDHEPDGWPAVMMRDITAMRIDIERMREALNIAGGALHRWVVSAYDDDERAQQQHVRDVGLEAVKFALRPNK